ncbi:MAG: branched chain amino acid aminotransferase [Bacteroidetes bacterium HGW-Bacteroidetes-7]|jgi:branched-chain amino acid aminotransferase|nr:MAG: branched chain amino acid aminotransferase [Bacteroidetes bacterium HGW-Bacteroidetes-7]
MDWSKLAFSYTKTNTIITSLFKNGEWGPLESSTDDTIRISALAGSLQYGIEAFEGLKAYEGCDGKIRLFRPEENAKRLKRSADFLGIQAPYTDMFIKACERAVLENREFLPPYSSGASLYIRPFIIGVNPQVGLICPNEVLFVVAVTPVGAYASEALKPIRVLLARDHDRAAPMGTGSYKIGGNYAAAMLAGIRAKEQGYSMILYLESANRKYIDEFSSSNFFGIKGNNYVTPDSDTVLPSITNKSLLQLAQDMGLTTERRKIALEELHEMDEIGACGTAVVITPVHEVVDNLNNRTIKVGESDRAGHISAALYNKLTGIQFGREHDQHNWCRVIAWEHY